MNAPCSAPSKKTALLQRTQRGALLVELLVAGILALLTGAALFAVITSQGVSDNTVRGQGTVNTAARQPMDVIADTLRNAQAAGLEAVTPALADAQASDITCYTSSNASTATRLYLENGSIKRQKIQIPVSGSTMAAVASDEGGKTVLSSDTILSGVTSLTFTYYMPNADYVADPTKWTKTADPHHPTALERTQVGAIQIAAQMSIDGYTRPLTTFVRLRNSPYRPAL